MNPSMMNRGKSGNVSVVRSCRVVVAALLGAGAVHAADLTLVGDSAVNWDTVETIWTNSAGSFVAFQPGDNVLISSDYFTGASLMMTERLMPGDVVFDIDNALTFGWSGQGGYNGNKLYAGLHKNTGSFVKRGKGTLLLVGEFASGTEKGNAMTCGVEIVEGEIACQSRNNWNYLGSSSLAHWVYVRDGASLTFLEGNQTGAASENSCAIKIQLDKGGRLNHCTNAVSSTITAALCVNTLKLCGGDMVNGEKAYQSHDSILGGACMMKIYKVLHFAGDTPHAFGFPDGTYPGYKHITMNEHLKGRVISLNAKAPVEIRVDDIDNGDGVDAYMNWKSFTFGQNAGGTYRADVVKTGAGTLCFPSNDVYRAFRGDFTVREGMVDFQCLSSERTFFNTTENDPLQTITVSTNAILRVANRNITRPGDNVTTPNIKIVIDHGTLDYITTDGRHGTMAARDWVFDDATLNVSNKGLDGKHGVFYFKNSVTFRGTRPFEMWPDTTLNVANQSVMVHNGTNTTGNTSGLRTIVDVADMTGDGRVDVVMGYHIWNGASTISQVVTEWKDSGFIKTGSGTFSVASTENKVSGQVTVSNGTMRVDGTLVTPSSIEIVAGAYLGGTGTCANVTMEAGAGFAAPAGQKTPLTVQGNLALAATGCVALSNLAGLDENALTSVRLATVTGTLSGTENLSSWTVLMDGVAARKWYVCAAGNTVLAKRFRGVNLSFR